jgi:hypothetical protein
MLQATDDGQLKLIAESYRLIFAIDRPYVYLTDSNGCSIADLFVLSAIHPLSSRDDTLSIGNWLVQEGLDEIIFSLEVQSSVWEQKVYRFRCFPERFVYEIELQGSGDLADVHYFGGYYSGHVRWGSGFFWSGQSFKQGFNPEPNVDEVNTFSPTSNTVIDLMGVPLPGKAGWFFTPPPFSYAFETAQNWIGLSVEARPGENQFTEYRYHGQSSSFYLSLSYEGHTPIEGRTVLPGIAFDFAPGPYEILEAHVQSLVNAGSVSIPLTKIKPGWWYQPIFCGWGSQCHLAAISNQRAPELATQNNYQSFLQVLSDHDISPGTIVIDDKWQANYGDNAVDTKKWPDITSFIQEQHLAGKKVLLWLKAWDPEGLPLAECISNAAGIPVSIDPTNPVYADRLRTSVRRMLSSDGYDADGFKIDFTARVPSGPGLRSAGKEWGLELMRLYLSILYSEAKKIKPDAFIITHTPHPYLADIIDSIRLNDINTGQDVCQAMIHRARVAAIACPEALIDSDNWPITDKATWRTYVSLKPGLGVPALYYATNIDSTGEALDDSDYDLIRTVWESYRKMLGLKQDVKDPNFSSLDVEMQSRGG